LLETAVLVAIKCNRNDSNVQMIFCSGCWSQDTKQHSANDIQTSVNNHIIQQSLPHNLLVRNFLQTRLTMTRMAERSECFKPCYRGVVHARAVTWTFLTQLANTDGSQGRTGSSNRP